MYARILLFRLLVGYVTLTAAWARLALQRGATLFLRAKMAKSVLLTLAAANRCATDFRLEPQQGSFDLSRLRAPDAGL
jgi:hypothetical protein